jgi:hypothetical protein
MSSSASPNKEKKHRYESIVPSGISRTAYKKSGAMQDGGIGRPIDMKVVNSFNTISPANSIF